MNKKNVDLGIDELVTNAIKKALPVIDESYVAEPKKYELLTDYLSQKSKESHIKLYKQRIESLNKISAKLDTADRSASNDAYASLKKCEARDINSVWLHELYFANCFAAQSEIYINSLAYMRLQRDFGTFDDWQRDFMACGLNVGNGWALCGYNMYLKRYVNTFVTDDSYHVMMGLYPLIVIDVHEHAYYKDYLTDKQSYLIAQMKELNWEIIEERFHKAEKINGALK